MEFFGIYVTWLQGIPTLSFCRHVSATGKVVVRTGLGLLNWRPFNSNTRPLNPPGSRRTCSWRRGTHLAPGWGGGNARPSGRPIVYPPSWPIGLPTKLALGLMYLSWVTFVFSAYPCCWVSAFPSGHSAMVTSTWGIHGDINLGERRDSNPGPVRSWSFFVFT